MRNSAFACDAVLINYLSYIENFICFYTALGTRYKSYSDRYYDMISKAFFLPRVGHSLWFLLKLERQRCTHVSIFSDFTIKRFKTSRNFTENRSYIGPQNGVGIPDGRSSSVKMHLACQWKHWNNHIVSSEFVRIHDKFPYFKILLWFSQSVSVSIETISRFEV